MTWEQWVSFYVAVPYVWAASLLFLVFYPLLQRFWKHDIGISLFWVDACIWGTLTPHMLRLFFGVDETSFGFTIFELVVFFLVGLGINWRTLILCRASKWKFRLPWKHEKNGD